MLRMSVLLACAVLSAPSFADEAGFAFGGDLFEAGERVVTTEPLAGDIFAAGRRVSVADAVEGSAHMAGQSVLIQADIGGNLYGAGQRVEVGGTIGGNATIAGNLISLTSPLAGNLRATGADVEIRAPISGSAMIGGDYVEIDAAIAGDVALSANEVIWGDNASIGGTLHIYASEAYPVPESVIAPDLIVFHETRSWDRKTFDEEGIVVEDKGVSHAVKYTFAVLLRIVVLGLLAALLAILMPNKVREMREAALARPLRGFAFGFLALSATIGAGFVIALTGIGILLLPVFFALAALLAFLGYLLGVYVLGAWILSLTPLGAPDAHRDRLIAGLAGSVTLGLIGLLPFLGWWACLVLMIGGVGAWTIRFLRPGFGVEA